MTAAIKPPLRPITAGNYPTVDSSGLQVMDIRLPLIPQRVYRRKSLGQPTLAEMMKPRIKRKADPRAQWENPLERKRAVKSLQI